MEQITTQDAIHLAFNTLFSQMKTIIAVSSKNVEMLEAFDDLMSQQKKFLSDTYSKEIDDFNAAAALVEKNNEELDQLTNLLTKAESTIKKIEKDGETREQELQKCLKISQQIAVQRDTYKKEAEELRPIKAERDRLKKQVDRNKESNSKLESKLNKAEQDKSRLKRDTLMASQSVVKMKQVCNSIQQALFYDGLAPERIEEINGVTYYFYRKPLIKTMMNIGEFNVSREHQYFFTVQTSIGTHRDILPGENGTYGLNKAQPLPKEVFSILQDEFSKETLFHTRETPIFATERLQKLFEEIDACLKEAA